MNQINFAKRGFEWLVLVELTLVSAILAVTMAVLLPHVEVSLFKTAFSEVLLAFSLERNQAIEQYAHAGAWSEAQLAQKVEPAEQRPAPASPRLAVNVVGDALVAAGTLRGRSFTIGMRPAVADHSQNWSMLWLCGAREAPAGWQAAPVGARTHLPTTHVPSVCRAESRR